MASKVGYRKISGPDGLLAQRAEFLGNTMRGLNGAPYFTGSLSRRDRELFEAARDKITYTVVSYSTPIAWITDDGEMFHVTDKFSTTTSKHQTYTRAWLR